MADGAQDRHLPASQRKLDQARRRGELVRSRDLTHFMALAVGGAALAVAAPAVSGWLLDALAEALRFDAKALADTSAMGERLAHWTTLLMMVALPAGLLMSAVGIACALGVGGWVWTFEPLGFHFGKLNPIAGLPRLVSKQQLIEALKAALLALLLAGVGGWHLARHLDEYTGALGLPLPSALSHASAAILAGLAPVVGVLALFALVDVPLQKHLHATRLKMSRQEAKEELKQVEGNLEIKGKLKALMRERAKRRMLAKVPKADLVVMNPTHYAVALAYDEASMAAPRVVAKGMDLLAFAIRDKAREHKVPVLESPPLARALYAHAPLDREIPARLFGAVAQVLAYVYQLRAAVAGRAPMPERVPQVEVPAELDPATAERATGAAL